MTAHPTPGPLRVRVRAPAKIDLHLAVGDRRDDGSYELVTVLHAVDLYDEVVITRAPRLTVRTLGTLVGHSRRTDLPRAAATALARRLGVAPAVAVEVDKRIPVSGGMAGSSADAAATLVGCAALWGAELTRETLAEIGSGIGAEVPFALTGGTAVGTGRGDRLSPVLARATLHWVLAIADGQLSPPVVFAELDRLRRAGTPPRAGGVTDMLTALASGDPVRVAALLANDLQAAAFGLRPDLRRTLRAGLDAGALGGIVCGSGPTLALLVADREEAGRVAAELAGSGTCRAVKIATGPAAGARVVDG